MAGEDGVGVGRHKASGSGTPRQDRHRFGKNGRRMAMKLTRDQARRIAANFAKLPELLTQPRHLRRERLQFRGTRFIPFG